MRRRQTSKESWLHYFFVSWTINFGIERLSWVALKEAKEGWDDCNLSRTWFA